MCKYTDVYVQHLIARAELAEKERDAAIFDMSKTPRCSICKYEYDDCVESCCFVWRGLCKENTRGDVRNVW